MELPILEAALVVTEHAAVFRDVFENQCQFRHFPHYLTGLIILPNKSMANIARCIPDRADTTTRSRFFSDAKQFPDLQIPTEKRAQSRLHAQVGLVLRQDPQYWAWYEPFRTKIINGDSQL